MMDSFSIRERNRRTLVNFASWLGIAAVETFFQESAEQRMT